MPCLFVVYTVIGVLNSYFALEILDRLTMGEDANQRAKRIVGIATGERSAQDPEPTGKQLGGKARMASLTLAQRRVLAEKAAAARWPKR